MRGSFILVFVGLISLRALMVPQNAMAYCAYGSTQARVQRDVTQPWSEHISVKQNESFRVGGFHDQTGQFASDTQLRVYGPTLNGQVFANEGVIGALQPGTYTLWVTTNGQSGGGCEEIATVTVEPVITCPYGSTQARVQKDIHSPWSEYIAINRWESFRVGSFHNSTGQFANDTKVTMYNPSLQPWQVYNGATVYGWTQGTYILWVTTNNHAGDACQAAAYVSVL